MKWQAQFPFWSESILHRTMKSLVEQGLVIVHKFNKNNWDRTNWYSINYERLNALRPKAEAALETAKEKKRSIEDKRRIQGRTILRQ